MANFLDRALNHALRFAAEEAKQSGSPVAKHLDACGVGECQKFSLGATCSQCSRYACNDHIFLTLTVPPTLICAECVALEFEVGKGNE